MLMLPRCSVVEVIQGASRPDLVELSDERPNVDLARCESLSHSP